MEATRAASRIAHYQLPSGRSKLVKHRRAREPGKKCLTRGRTRNSIHKVFMTFGNSVIFLTSESERQ